MSLGIYLLIGVLILLILPPILLYNSLIGARNLVQTAYSDIDVHLTKRFTLVPNLVVLTRNYAGHESQTLLDIVEKRSEKLNVEQTAQLDQQLTGSLQQIRVIVENYPELKADSLFNQLMKDLGMIEDDLLFARRFYNGAVRTLNTKIQSFPSNLVASAFGFKTQPFYQVNDPEERNIPVTH